MERRQRAVALHHKRWDLDIPYAEWRRRRQIVLAGNPSCNYCPAVATTVDHVIPLSAGGTSDLDNLRPACLPCNSAKRNGNLPGRGISPTKGQPHAFNPVVDTPTQRARPAPRLP